MRISWIPDLYHFVLNSHVLSFAGTSVGWKSKGMVQGTTFDRRLGALQGFQWCISVSGADDHSTEGLEKVS